MNALVRQPARLSGRVPILAFSTHNLARFHTRLQSLVSTAFVGIGITQEWRITSYTAKAEWAQDWPTLICLQPQKLQILLKAFCFLGLQ
jgi:hypothetical protein